MGVATDALQGVVLAWAAEFSETVFPKFVTLLGGDDGRPAHDQSHAACRG